MPSHRQQKPFAKVAFTASTPEEFGVLFMKKILRSASDNKITSADSKSLVVPFAVTVTRPSHEGLGKLDTVDCVQTCWSCLGHQVFCVTKCTTIHQELSPGRTPPGDETLRRLVTPGPPLANPELVEQGLATSLLRVDSPMEVGIILINSVLVILSQRADLVGADGSAELTGVAKVSLPKSSAGPASADGGTYNNICVETCYSILGHEIVCYRKCHTVVVE
jgi:hypothetical protein